ncbi:hypothetical protein [Prochlorococcus sp. MIT 1303]|uniref:hypothetical protein n=1 Tax=Prochlorococcus sp. MIT 1303 TaxID=1723647 RepID=UPI0007B3C131|nr:hypothetical protein [Prochlorococcus sp. MIT 1303]KZR64542.1 hypothetical protein PMIT1303_01587 [Prochlorococcus sp. MIT 1303]
MQQVHSFGVDLVATKGYPSATQMYELAREIDDYIRNGQAVELLVCADFDPEGDDWPRAALEQIRGNVSALHMVDSQRVLVTREDLDDIGPAMQYIVL